MKNIPPPVDRVPDMLLQVVSVLEAAVLGLCNDDNSNCVPRKGLEGETLV